MAQSNNLNLSASPYYEDWYNFAPYNKIHFKTAVENKPREIGAMWGYEMTTTLKEPEPLKNKLMSEGMQKKVVSYLDSFWEKAWLNACYGPLAVVTNIVEEKNMKFISNMSSNKKNTVLGAVQKSGQKVEWYEILVEDGSWKERDEVCTERRIADLERDNERLRKERDDKGKALASLTKLNKVAMSLAESYKKQLEAALEKLVKAGLVKPGQNIQGEQVASPMMALPGKHADWRRIVEAENESDQ